MYRKEGDPFFWQDRIVLTDCQHPALVPAGCSPGKCRGTRRGILPRVLFRNLEGELRARRPVRADRARELVGLAVHRMESG